MTSNGMERRVMRLLVFEYACAGGPGGRPFLEEGRRMLQALVADLNRAGLNGVITSLFLPSIDSSSVQCGIVPVRGSLMEFAAAEMKRHDAAWIIAPETGGRLLHFTRLVESLGRRSFGCASPAVEICSDKYLTAQRLSSVVETVPTARFVREYAGPFPCVVKPADGAGAGYTFFADGKEALAALALPAGTDFVVQPFIRGGHFSAGLISRGAGDVELLGVCRQEIGFSSKISFTGVTGPVRYTRTEEVRQMARKIKYEIPGLKGYWGIDFIDTENGPVMVEINPRLTSSYPLYSAASKFNIPRYLITGARE